MKKLIFLICLLVTFSAFGANYDLVLRWDENTEQDISIYQIYIRAGQSMENLKTNADYIIPVLISEDEDTQTAVFEKTISQLSTDPDVYVDDDIQYFICVTALDTFMNESDLSNEIFTLTGFIDDENPTAIHLYDAVGEVPKENYRVIVDFLTGTVTVEPTGQ